MAPSSLLSRPAAGFVAALKLAHENKARRSIAPCSNGALSHSSSKYRLRQAGCRAGDLPDRASQPGSLAEEAGARPLTHLARQVLAAVSSAAAGHVWSDHVSPFGLRGWPGLHARFRVGCECAPPLLVACTRGWERFVEITSTT